MEASTATALLKFLLFSWVSGGMWFLKCLILGKPGFFLSTPGLWVSTLLTPPPHLVFPAGL